MGRVEKDLKRTLGPMLPVAQASALTPAILPTAVKHNAMLMPLNVAQASMKKPKGPSAPGISASEQGLIDDLVAKSEGQGEFMADMKGAQDLAKAQAMSQSLAASQRGVSPAQAARLATANMGQMQADLNANQVLAREAERQAAQQGALQQFASIRGGNLEAQRLKDQRNQANQNMMGNLLGGLGAAGIMAFSDERVKTEIEPGEKSVREFLSKVAPKKYAYKSTEYGDEGKHVSVMAQDLEKSEVGKRMVIDTPQGKMVDYSKGLPAMLAAQADLHKRLEQLEAKNPTAKKIVEKISTQAG